MRKNKNLILVIFLGIQIVGISVIKRYPEFVEQFYSSGIYPVLSKMMRYAFGWLPFSMGDLLYTLSIIYIVRWLFQNRKRLIKDTVNWLLEIGATVSIVYLAFHLLWAYNYYREPLNTALGIKAGYTTDELLEFTNRLIEKSNNLHKKLSSSDTLKIEFPYSKSQIFEKAPEGYSVLSKSYPHWNYQPSSLKKSIYSLPLTYMGFSGYLNPFTNEAQVDGLIPTYKFPTTSCHEIAHQLGYAAENEANFIGCLAAISNKDMYFQYSGYTFALRYCLNEIYERDASTYDRILPNVNTGILKNYKEVQDFWLAYENLLEPVFEQTFDNFLKVNNQSDGMKSYSYVVALLVNYFKDQPF